MEAFLQRTGDDNFRRDIKMLLQGPPKSGKTSFLATAPGIVIADCEPEANGLQSIAHLNVPYVEISSIDKIQQLHVVLRDESLRKQAAESLGLEKIETVAVDTMDALQKIYKKERKRDMRREFQRDDWGWLGDQMRELINAFNSLPLNVIYTVHTTSVQDDDEKIVTMPNLQGSIKDDIAGMVGYSVLMQRTREVRSDGSPYTKYSLKVEGDDKNPHLGTRVGARLPEIIEPDFRKFQEAVEASRQEARQRAPKPVEVKPVDLQVTTAQEPAQNVGQSEAAAPAQAGPPDDSGQPVNATALQHLQRLYAEVGLHFDQDVVSKATLGQARSIVQMFRALKQDEAEGKIKPEEGTVAEQMQTLIKDFGFVSEAPAAQAEPAPVEPKVDGTIEQVMAYVGQDKAKAQEAYDLEVQRPKPRTSLVNYLQNQGAQQKVQVQTDVQTDQPEPATQAVTSEPVAADTPPTEEQALETVKEVLGGEVIAEEPTPDGPEKPCEECGKPVDDPDIAVLSRGRFDRWLCVADYIAETRKPRAEGA